MKTLLLTTLLALGAAEAQATQIACDGNHNLKLDFFSRGSLLAEGDREPLIVVADGVLRLTYTTTVKKLPESTPDRLALEVKSYQQSGWHSMKPVEGKIQFDLKGTALAGTGHLTITNDDHGNGLLLEREIRLENCTGTL